VENPKIHSAAKNVLRFANLPPPQKKKKNKNSNNKQTIAILRTLISRIKIHDFIQQK